MAFSRPTLRVLPVALFRVLSDEIVRSLGEGLAPGVNAEAILAMLHGLVRSAGEPRVRSALAETGLGAVLTMALGHPDPAVRNVAADALDFLPAGAEEDLVRVMLDDDQDLVVLRAAELLGRHRPDALAPVMVELLGHRRAFVRARAAELSGSFAGVVDVESALLPLLSDPEPEVRSAVCVVLGRLVDPVAVPGLLGTLRDGDAGVRQAATHALAAIRF